MSERAQQLMNSIWEARNNGADTEEKLVSEILKLLPNIIKNYKAQNDLAVLDSEDLIELSNEIENLSK